MSLSTTISLGQVHAEAVPATTQSPIIVLEDSRNRIDDSPWLLHLSGYRAMVVPARLDKPGLRPHTRPALIVSYLLPGSSRSQVDTCTYLPPEYPAASGWPEPAHHPPMRRAPQPLIAAHPRRRPDTSRYYLAISRGAPDAALPFPRAHRQPER